MANNGTLVVQSAQPSALPVAVATGLVLAAQGRPEAREVRFVAAASADDQVVLSFVEPFVCAAVVGPTTVDALRVVEDGEASVDRLLVWFVPGGAAASLEEQREVDRWIEAAPVGSRPVIDLLIRGDRIRWRAGRCVIQGSPERFWEILQAIASFSFYEGRLRKLETELQALLPTAEKDVVLSGRVDARSLARWRHVDHMTEATARRRIEFARIEPHLEKPPLTLPITAQRAIAELVVQADVEDRLVYVDDRLDVFEELYGDANEKLRDYSYFRREYLIEVAIVGVLLVQMTIELFIRIR